MWLVKIYSTAAVHSECSLTALTCMATKEVIEDNNIWITVSTAQTENSGQKFGSIIFIIIIISNDF